FSGSFREIFLALGYQIKSQVAEKCRKANWFGLLCDEVCDISNQEQLLTFIKYVDPQTNKATTDFLSANDLFQNSQSADANTIWTVLNKQLEDSKLEKSKLASFASDGASVMTGKKNGVAAKLRSDNKPLINVHCIAHRLALACGDASNSVSYILTMEKILIQLWSLFKNSPKKAAKYAKAVMHASELGVTNAMTRRGKKKLKVKDSTALIDSTLKQWLAKPRRKMSIANKRPSNAEGRAHCVDVSIQDGSSDTVNVHDQEMEDESLCEQEENLLISKQETMFVELRGALHTLHVDLPHFRILNILCIMEDIRPFVEFIEPITSSWISGILDARARIDFKLLQHLSSSSCATTSRMMPTPCKIAELKDDKNRRNWTQTFQETLFDGFWYINRQRYARSQIPFHNGIKRRHNGHLHELYSQPLDAWDWCTFTTLFHHFFYQKLNSVHADHHFDCVNPTSGAEASPVSLAIGELFSKCPAMFPLFDKLRHSPQEMKVCWTTIRSIIHRLINGVGLKFSLSIKLNTQVVSKDKVWNASRIELQENKTFFISILSLAKSFSNESFFNNTENSFDNTEPASLSLLITGSTCLKLSARPTTAATTAFQRSFFRKSIVAELLENNSASNIILELVFALVLF
ncbi:zinc finger 862-like, partial [Paramuricea clavata]